MFQSPEGEVLTVQHPIFALAMGVIGLFQSPEGEVLTVQLNRRIAVCQSFRVSVPRRESADGATLGGYLGDQRLHYVSVPRRGSADGATRFTLSPCLCCGSFSPPKGKC